jgi:hypothetical protein
VLREFSCVFCYDIYVYPHYINVINTEKKTFFPFNLNATRFSWTIIMSHSKAKLISVLYIIHLFLTVVNKDAL